MGTGTNTVSVENGNVKLATDIGDRMSLDVYLTSAEPVECSECGHRTKKEYVYEANITHNLNKMAEEAGIYEALWRPEEIGITKADQLIGPLERGVELMRSDPERFKKHNAPNGWGLYEHFVPFVEEYLVACRKFREAIVSVSR